jgi:hypothetical protein
MERHTFDTDPQTVVWFQIAGLAEEHLALLRYSYQEASRKTSFETYSCGGKLWNYNLYNIRPSSTESFNSQMLGVANIKGNCEDLNHKPIWSDFQEKGHDVVFFEIGAHKDQGLRKFLGCENFKKYYHKTTILEMVEKPKASEDLFHFQDKKKFSAGKIYYDKSCRGNGCYSSILNNADMVLTEIQRRNKPFNFLIVRDFSFERALAQNKIGKAREILLELDSLHFNIKKVMLNKDKETLVLVTSTAARPIEFPNQGKQWKSYEKAGKNIIYKKPSLISSAWAWGSRAENFCGFYEESQIFSRFSSPFKGQGLLRRIF